MKKLLPLTAMLLPVLGFAQHLTSGQIIEQSRNFEQLRNNWALYLETKQLNKAMDQYTNDAIFYSPGAENAVGKAAITKLYQLVMKQFNTHIQFYHSGIILSGNLASYNGDYSETMEDNTTHKIAKLKGSYLMVLTKKPEGWKISRIMWTDRK